MKKKDKISESCFPEGYPRLFPFLKLSHDFRETTSIKFEEKVTKKHIPGTIKKVLKQKG